MDMPPVASSGMGKKGEKLRKGLWEGRKGKRDGRRRRQITRTLKKTKGSKKKMFGGAARYKNPAKEEG